MTKNHRISSLVKSIKNTTNKSLPIVDKGLKRVGKATKNIVETSIALFEQGVSTVYDTISKGLDLGVTSVKSVTKRVTSKQSKSRTKKGGKKSRKHRKH